MRYHKGSDPWGRGSYEVPNYAVAGASDTGTLSDSPCPSNKVEKELNDFITFLKTKGIKAKFGKSTQSGNIFMGKRWVEVSKAKYAEADALAEQYLKDHDKDTSYIHDGH